MTGLDPGRAASGRRAGSGLRRRVYLLMAIGIFFPLMVISVVGWYWLRDLGERLQASRSAAAETMAAHFDEELTGDLVQQTIDAADAEPLAVIDRAASMVTVPVAPIAGGELFYESEGSGPPLLLVPGLGGIGAFWRLQAAAWRDRFRAGSAALVIK